MPAKITKARREELRVIVEAAKTRATSSWRDDAMRLFVAGGTPVPDMIGRMLRSLDPDTVLALLSLADRAEAAEEKAAAWDWYEGGNKMPTYVGNQQWGNHFHGPYYPTALAAVNAAKETEHAR